MSLYEKKEVEQWLNECVYGNLDGYVPSTFALEFVEFIKMVNGAEGEENKTPVVHYRMLDQVAGRTKQIANMCHRGLAKTTVLGEYLFLYIGVYGSIPEFGTVPFAIYVSDSIENGVKNMRKNLEYRWENSEFLQQYIPNVKFTDIEWQFNNIEGTRTIIKGYGAKTGVRGAKAMGRRPVLAVLDDLISDEDAKSETIIENVENTVHKAVKFALHPNRQKTIWSGTPFNARDPLYKAVESGAWAVNVYPVCEQFPCTREEFRGSWEDRFTYDYVMEAYQAALDQGKVDSFNQELMLRIMSEEDRLVTDNDIRWFNTDSIMKNLHSFNIYITTDFATGENKANDFSVISVWAYSSNGDWFLIDGVCERQLMDQNMRDLFRLAQRYRPISVGIEVSGQQGAFISLIKERMHSNNCYFTLASENNNNREGIRPVSNQNKLARYSEIVVPWFKAGKIHFPSDKQDMPIIRQAINETSLVSRKGFKSKHDDVSDTMTMLGYMNAWRPSIDVPIVERDKIYWAEDDMMDDDDDLLMLSYVV